MKWRLTDKELPPIGVKVEGLWRFIPCPYYVEIGIYKESDSKTFTGICFREKSKKYSLGWRWRCDVGTPSSHVEAWRTLDGQLSIKNFDKT